MTTETAPDKGQLAYMRERFLNNLYDAVMRKFMDRGWNERRNELRKSLGWSNRKFMRFISNPCDWRFADISDFLAVVGPCELDMTAKDVDLRWGKRK